MESSNNRSRDSQICFIPSTKLASALVVVGVMVMSAFGNTTAVFGLPEQRAYEMVSPSFKAGQSAVAVHFDASLNGEAVAFFSVGAFDESPSSLEQANGYLAERAPTGEWFTSSRNPPTTLKLTSNPEAQPAYFGRTSPQDYTSNLETAVYDVAFTPNRETTKESEVAFYERKETGEFHQASPTLKPVGGASVEAANIEYVTASANMSKLIVSSLYPLTTSDIGTTGRERLYEVAGADTATPTLSPVGIYSNGAVIDEYCEVLLGSGSVSAFHAVSAGGSEIFFTTNINAQPGERCDTPVKPNEFPNEPAQVFMRVDGNTTVRISERRCTDVPCSTAKDATAVFRGASSGGEKVFFTTSQPLVNNDRDATNDLYEAEISDGIVQNLIMVSEGNATDPTRGEGGDVLGVTRISDDGSHIYFGATGVLTTKENAEDHQKAERGADNLYVYNTVTRETKFVAATMTAVEKAAITAHFGCSSKKVIVLRRKCEREEAEALAVGEVLWGVHDDRPAQATPDGSFLVFATEFELLHSVPERDTHISSVYRYDAQTESLARISVAEGDYVSNSNVFGATISAPDFVLPGLHEQGEMGTRAISRDGSMVVFLTQDQLSPLAVNGLENVYVWHEGSVALISDGHSPTNDGSPVISLSGRDIFFGTSDGIASSDADGLVDIYDARIGGGTAQPAALTAPCLQDACQGPLSAAPSFGVPGSATFSSPGNLTPPVSKPLTRAQKLAKALRACRTKHNKHKRASCKTRARKRYGSMSKSNKGGK